NHDPIALLAAIAKAEKAETDEEKKVEISELRLFILNNQDALTDYRQMLKEKDKDLDPSWMRSMGAAESNMNLFSRRLKKMGYSWSPKGLKSMINALIHRFEGTLTKAIINASASEQSTEKPSKAYPSFATLLTERTQ